MSVVHLWNGHGNIGGTWSMNQCAGETWCGAGVDPGDDAVLDGEIDQVTCTICLGMASDFGGACLSRLRELSKVTEPAWVAPLLERLDFIARATVHRGHVAQLAIAVADLVKHIAAKGQP